MSSEGKKILLVDDDEDYRSQVQMRLEAAGFEVIAADSEKGALDVIERVRPDAAILDLMMENMDSGIVVCHRLKKLHPDVPVILVTAVASETGILIDSATRDEKSWIQADAVLDKPVRYEQLEREIKRLLKA